MACFHPIPAYYRIREDGKKDIKFVSDNSLPYYREGELIYGHVIDIPCGQCIGCRLDYTRQWAVRCVLESSRWKNNLFLTITYDDDHLPEKRPLCDYNTGEVVGYSSLHSLEMADIQKFIKRVRIEAKRKYNHDDIRVFYCGEYGDKSFRPHYHMILFNVPDIELVLYSKNHSGDVLYNSPWIDSLWGKGFIVIGKVTFESCAYVARYVMKKQKGRNASMYEAFNVQPEFCNMSRRPGIGRYYFDSNYKKIYSSDEIVLPDKNNIGRYIKPPGYFDSLYTNLCPTQMKDIKENRRKLAANSTRQKLSQTSLSKNDLLSKMEESLEIKVDKLIRSI